MEIFKIVGVAILTCVAGAVIKQVRQEFFVVVVLAGSLIILFMVVDKLQELLNFVSQIFNKTGLNYDFFANLLKILGVGILTEFASGLCVDSGNTAVANKVIIAGKVIIASLSLPIIWNLLEVVISILP